MTGQSGDTRGEVIYAVINHEAICYTSAATPGWTGALVKKGCPVRKKNSGWYEFLIWSTNFSSIWFGIGYYIGAAHWAGA